MALRTIITDESPKLRMISREQTTFDERLHQLLDDMRETLEHANGAGLAAVQVGILRRIAIVDVGEGVIELINPVILSAEGEQEVTEGCLSVVGKWGRTIRPANVKVKAYDRNGKEFEIEGEGILALAMVHEIDHLDGKLYTDIVIGELWEDEE
ncbi:MAG: peptide deformylase [Clostridia bacterium]|nr:peptide deformylase [Clostridia bacterium]